MGKTVTLLYSANLIIFDFWDTLVSSCSEKVEWRQGAKELLEKLSDKTKAISSDASRTTITEFLESQPPYFNAIYDETHTFRRNRQTYKNLGRICNYFKVKPATAVMIGDSQTDKASARKYKIPFIEVPSAYDNKDYNLSELLKQ